MKYLRFIISLTGLSIGTYSISYYFQEISSFPYWWYVYLTVPLYLIILIHDIFCIMSQNRFKKILIGIDVASCIGFLYYVVLITSPLSSIWIDENIGPMTFGVKIIPFFGIWLLQVIGSGYLLISTKNKE